MSEVCREIDSLEGKYLEINPTGRLLKATLQAKKRTIELAETLRPFERLGLIAAGFESSKRIDGATIDHDVALTIDLARRLGNVCEKY